MLQTRIKFDGVDPPTFAHTLFLYLFILAEYINIFSYCFEYFSYSNGRPENSQTLVSLSTNSFCCEGFLLIKKCSLTVIVIWPYIRAFHWEFRYQIGAEECPPVAFYA